LAPVFAKFGSRKILYDKLSNVVLVGKKMVIRLNLACLLGHLIRFLQQRI